KTHWRVTQICTVLPLSFEAACEQALRLHVDLLDSSAEKLLGELNWYQRPENQWRSLSDYVHTWKQRSEEDWELNSSLTLKNLHGKEWILRQTSHVIPSHYSTP